MSHAENLPRENFSPGMRLPICGGCKGTTSMQYKSMVLLFMMMLGMVFSPGLAMGASKFVKDKCDSGEKVSFSNLMYVGQKVNSTKYGDCIKVSPVNDDTTATRACGSFGMRWVLNPGNPQYQPQHTNAYGSQGFNNLNYYYCLTNFSKQKMCESFANDPNFKKLNVEWKPNSSGKDGDCMCGANKNKMHDCGDGIPAVSGAEDAEKCRLLGGHYTPGYEEAATCICDADSTLRDVQSSTLQCPDTKVIEAAVPGTESKQITDCVSEFEGKLTECKQLADKANATCDQNNESNKNIDTAKNFVSSISKLLIQKAAGTGAQSQCAGANMLASGTFNLLNELKGSCDKELTTCKEKCSEIKEGLPAYCKSKIVPDEKSPPDQTPDDKYIAEQNKKFASQVIETQKICTVQAVEKKDLLRDSLRAYDSAAKSAATCACQLSASGSDCATLPGPADCHFDPTNPICRVVDPLNCDLGTANYASQRCQCLQDSSLPFCQAPPGKIPFAFANDLKGVSGFGGGGGDVSAGGGGGGEGGMDLGGLSQQDARSDSKGGPQADAPGIGVNPGGGGGGGSSGGGGGAGEGGAAAEAGGDPAEKSLGIMGMVKNAVGNMFGSKPGSAANNKGSGKSLPGYDVDKWRPRGLASTGCNVSQIRCKNEDIFTIMNRRYLNNEMSFIQNP